MSTLPDKVFQFKVFNLDFLNFKWEFVTIANFFVDDKTHIDSEGLTRIRHGIFSIDFRSQIDFQKASESELDFSIYNKLRQIFQRFFLRGNWRVAQRLECAADRLHVPRPSPVGWLHSGGCYRPSRWTRSVSFQPPSGRDNTSSLFGFASAK